MSAPLRAPANDNASPATVRAWDWPTRVFHWLLVALIVSAYVTRTFLADPTLYLHRLNGYAVLTLLLFRVLWGVVGSSTSRFAAFFPWPRPTLRYVAASLRGARPPYLGHNPLGSILILLMLLAVAAQAVSGLCTSDDVIAQGPLHSHVADWFGDSAASYHAKGFWIVLGLAALHIVANLIYQFALRDRLITAMITGAKPVDLYLDEADARVAPGCRAVACFAIAATVVAGGVMLAGDSLLR